MTTTMLYRPSDTPNPDVWGRLIEHRVFADAAVASALADGWSLHPDEVGAEPVKAEVPEAPKRRGRPPKEG